MKYPNAGWKTLSQFLLVAAIGLALAMTASSVCGPGYPGSLPGVGWYSDAPHWSADGSLFYAAASEDGNRVSGDYGTSLYAIRADGSRLSLIHFEKTRRDNNIHVSGLAVSAPDVFPDGRIVYASIFGDDDFDIVVADHDGSNARNLTHNNTRDQAPVWSPDGSRIAFISRRHRIGDSYGYGLYTMLPDGSDVRFVAPVTSADVTRPVWSPDGQHIAFLVKEYHTPDGFEGTPEPYEKVSKLAIKVARWDGTEIIRLGILEGVSQWSGGVPQWSKDGKSIVYLTEQGLFEIDAFGSGQEPRSLAVFENNARMSEIYWSPDGSEARMGGGRPMVLGKDSVRILSYAETDSSEYHLDHFHGNWSPDGSRIGMYAEYAQEIPGKTWTTDYQRIAFYFTMYPDGSDQRVLMWSDGTGIKEGRNRLLPAEFGGFVWEEHPIGPAAPAPFRSTEPRDVSGIALFAPESGGAGHGIGYEPPTV